MSVAAGSIKLKYMLPISVQGDFDTSKHLDKKGVQNLISDIISKSGKDAPDAITRISNEFFGQSTKHGYSTPLSDYWNDSEDRRTMLQEFKTKIDQINIKKVDQSVKNDMINELTNTYGTKLTKDNLKTLIDKGSTAARMALTQARGNPQQLMQATSSPLISKRIDGTPIPVAITSSYAEGLSTAEQLAMSYWGRGNTVQAQLSTSKPGAMFKDITPNLYHEVVTEPDCHTKNGNAVSISDKRRLIGMYEGPTGHFIDEAYLKDLKSSGKNTIIVRMPSTCTSKDGVCQKCYGKDSRGTLPDIGENVGVLAAQSASEVLTQMILSTKHDAKAGKSVNPFDVVNNILTNPATFKDKAIISQLNGTVESIIKTPLNDNKVFVNGHEHFVPRKQRLAVKVGDKVLQGDQLSEGIINPRELVKLRGIGAGREYISKKLDDIYLGAGNKLDPRHFDLISKNMVKHVEVLTPGDTSYLPGQKVSINSLQKEIGRDSEETHIDNSTGKMLSRQVLHMVPGTILDLNHIDELKSRGIDTVHTSKSNLSVKHLVPGLKSVKMLDENWVSRLAGKDLGKSLKTGVIMGQSSDIHSTDPITAYLMGSEFGTGKDGKY